MYREKDIRGYNFIIITCITMLLFFACFTNCAVYARAADGIEIVFTGREEIAYTNENATEAYIYYDVIDKYGNSIRTSVNIVWSISSADIINVDTSSGKITIRKSKDGKESYKYGENIYVTGVDVKNSKSVNGVFIIGMVQALDEVEMEGFVNSKGDKSKIEKALPLDFAKNTWHLLYIAKDQNGNVCDTEKYDPGKLTFITDQPLLVDSVFSAGDLYTIDGIKYASILVNPGQNAKQGGKVVFSAVSNKTGRRVAKTFTIGGMASQDSGSNDNSNYNADNTQNTDYNNYPDNSYDSNNTNISVPSVLKKEQKIQAESVTKVYGCKSFYLGAVTSGDGKLAYSSSNRKVAYVDSTGKVHIKGYGETVIIIRAQETNEYKSAARRITITVIPEAVLVKEAFSPSRGKIQYKWKKHKNVSGYEIYIDTKKNFKTKQSKSVTKNRVSLKINNVLSGKIYYMKVRAYKNIGEKKYYGKWSKVKTVRVK